MPTVVGITLRTAGKLYYFHPGTISYDRDDRVLVETARGLELGTVKQPPHEVTDDQVVPPLKNVIRRATTADLMRDRQNRDREQHALEVCKRLVEKLGLTMRLIDAQYTFDCSHVLFHFLAENRVDFRELVRELAHELHTRIELRQVGVRDEAKLLGGYGICGRALCCSSFLANFVPVAINTAKEQGLALNPQKISGMCGRLMCCLAYEHEAYKEISSQLPRLNAQVQTPHGVGKVTKVNVLARQVEVTIPDAAGPAWFTMDELASGHMAPCCAATGACACHDATADAVVADTPSPAVEQPAPRDEPRRRRPRRRGGAPPSGNEGDSRPVASTPEAIADTPARKNRRRRKPRAPQTAAAPAPSAAVETVAAPNADHPMPSGRYRPRRRRS